MKSLIALLFALPLAAAEPSLSDQLRDALYTEEVERKPAEAAENYAKILADFDTQRPLAATALFRLAEIRRNADEKKQAIALYQRLLREFPDREAEAKLARQHLAELGGEEPGNPGPMSEEDSELQRLKKLAATAPDVVHDPATLTNAIKRGWPKVLSFLLSKGVRLDKSAPLTLAASSGRLDLCKILLEQGEPLDADKKLALRKAIERNRSSVLNYLLENGLGANDRFEVGKTETTPLYYAVGQENLPMVTQLLDHGADVNAIHDTRNATALHQAIIIDHPEIFKLLIARDAEPDLVAPNFNLSPLHCASLSDGDHALEFTTTLLSLGADPNRQAKLNEPGSNTLPLQRAINRADPKRAAALIEAGAKISPSNLEAAINSDHPAMLRLLLDHRPRFEPDDPIAQNLLTRSLEGDPAIPEMLIAHGATAPDGLIDSLFETSAHTSTKARSLVNQAFLLPKLTGQPKVQLLVDQIASQKLITLADQASDSTPPPLAQALLEADLSLPVAMEGKTNYQLLLWRKNQAGALQSIDIDLGESDPLPILQWGDVVEVRPTTKEANRNYQFVSGWRSSIRWDLTRRIVTPFTLTVGDETREITIRGDHLAYDPTQSEVPYISTPATLRLLRPDLFLISSSETKVTIQRDGWQDMVTTLASKTLDRHRIRPGDRLRLEPPSLTPLEREPGRKNNFITLRVPGTSYLETFHSSKAAQPSLIEVLTLVYAAEHWRFTRENFASINPSQDLKFQEIHGKLSLGYDFTTVVLPHPDLSSVTIHRPDSDGTVKTIKVDLAKAIDAFSADTTADQARQADVSLQIGDIIDLPLKADKQPWTGFSPEQSAFFHKVLSGDIMITYLDGSVIQHSIDWQPTRWIPTPAGILPLPPASGVSSNRAINLGFRSNRSGSPDLALTRNGKDLGDVGIQTFLRDGDRVQYDSNIPIDNVQQSTNSQQRSPRVVPTPPARRVPRIKRVPTLRQD